jgi:hypothetical protein
MKRISALLGGAVFGVAILAACGGGGGGSGTSSPGGALPPGAPTAGPTVAPSQNFSSTDAVPIPSPAPGATSVPVPLASDASGASANASISASANVPPDTTVASTYSSAGDSSLPSLAIKRATQSARGLRDGSSGRTVIAYLRLQFSADVTLPQAPAFTFVVPGTLPTNGVTYWLAFIDPLLSAAGWQTGFEGPATVTPATTAGGKSGTQLAFASNGKPLSFVAGQVYYFAVYAVSATAATPTPVPSTVPSNPPPDSKPSPVGVTPRNIQFTSVTASTPAPITFVQQGFSGPFTLHGDCTGIVNTSGASPTWTITPVGQGRCVIVGLGDKGASAIVHVGVITPYETPGPTSGPTTSPTNEPTTAPSHSPEPTHAPTTSPTTSPTTAPSHSPEPTHAPTTSPTSQPTTSPSHSPEPTHPPTTAPSTGPTNNPNASPTPSPTPTPTPGTAAGQSGSQRPR